MQRKDLSKDHLNICDFRQKNAGDRNRRPVLTSETTKRKRSIKFRYKKIEL